MSNQYYSLKYIFLCGIFMLYYPILLGQSEPDKDATLLLSQALTLSEIPQFGQATQRLEKNIDALVLQQNDLDEIVEEINKTDAIIIEKLKWLKDTTVLLRLDKLDNEEIQLNLIQKRADQWQIKVQEWVKATEQSNDSIYTFQQIWETTLDSLELSKKIQPDIDASIELSMDRVHQRIRSNLNSLSEKHETLSRWRIKLREAESSLTVTLGELNEAILLLDSKREIVVNQIWIPGYPPIWKMDLDGVDISPISVVKQQHNTSRTIIESFIDSHPQFLHFIIFFFVFILTVLLYLKHKIIKKISQYYDELIEVKIALKYPLFSALIILWFITFLFFDIPKDLHRRLLIYMVIPFSFMLWQLLPKDKWKNTGLFFFLYLVFFTLPYLSDLTILFRITLLGIDLISLGIFIALQRRKEYISEINPYWLGTLPFLITVFTAISAIAIISNSIGNVQIAYLLTNAMLGIFISFIILREAVLLVRAYIYLILLSPLYRHSNILKNDQDLILKRINKLLTILGYISWIYIILDLMKIYDSLSSALIRFVTTPISVGKMSISLGNVLAFYIIMQISLWLSSFIRYFLKKEVYPRVQLSKGVPSTISLMVRYTISLLGFLLALAGAGIEPGKVAIALGALGVGIGFGLQNIVNNFISGIILALERPIKIGDKLQIDDVVGTVKDIGLRASQIRTSDGSDVLVPNGDFISNKLTNWTFSNRKRRINIELRIPSDSNMENITKLVLNVTNDITGLLKKPKPYLYYESQSDNTSILRFYAWIKNLNDKELIETKVRTRIYEELHKAGYEIPNPKMEIELTNVSFDNLEIKNKTDPSKKE